MTNNETDDVLKALREELSSVRPSADFAVKVRQRIAGELDLLREELAAVNPSPEFKVRVRQQIEADAEMRPARWLSGWRWLIPTGAAAAVVVAIIAISRPDQTPPVTPVPVVASKPLSPIVQSPAVANVPPVGITAQQRPPSARVAPLMRPVEPVNVSAAAVTTEPVFEVITNQPALLAEMWARVGTASVTTTGAASEPVVGGEVFVVPVEVSPVVVKWLVEPMPSIGPLPIIRRVSADAERSPR